MCVCVCVCLCVRALQVLSAHGEVLDLHRVYTNNIHSMAATYGIEAAATTIVRVSPTCLWPTWNVERNVYGNFECIVCDR